MCMRGEKNSPWIKRRKREKVVTKIIVERHYQYKPTMTAISYANYITYNWQSRYGNNLIGVRAFKEVIMFLKTFKNFESPMWYKLALEVALEKLKGEKFVNENGSFNVIKSTEDVQQTIQEVLMTVGINEPVKKFVMKSVV